MGEEKEKHHFGVSLTAQVGLEASASAKMRTLIEKIIYELACQHATDAGTASKKAARNDELRHAIQAIILAAACMEAFINQEAIKILSEEFDAYDEGQIDIWGKPLEKRRGYPNLEDKWCEITQRVANKQFAKGRQAFQGFRKLVKLRNDILHYKATSTTPAPSPWPEMSGSVTQERVKFTANAAQNAVKSVKGMLEEFHRLVGIQLPEWVK